MIIACKNCIYLEECQKKNQPFDTDTECLTAESKKTYNKGYQQGRADAYKEIIEKCEQYSYTCHSSEMAKLLKEWLQESEDKNGENT